MNKSAPAPVTQAVNSVVSSGIKGRARLVMYFYYLVAIALLITKIVRLADVKENRATKVISAIGPITLLVLGAFVIKGLISSGSKELMGMIIAGGLALGFDSVLQFVEGF